MRRSVSLMILFGKPAILCYYSDDPTSVGNGECMNRLRGVFVTRTSGKDGVILEPDGRIRNEKHQDKSNIRDESLPFKCSKSE